MTYLSYMIPKTQWRDINTAASPWSSPVWSSRNRIRLFGYLHQKQLATQTRRVQVESTAPLYTRTLGPDTFNTDFLIPFRSQINCDGSSLALVRDWGRDSLRSHSPVDTPGSFQPIVGDTGTGPLATPSQAGPSMQIQYAWNLLFLLEDDRFFRVDNREKSTFPLRFKLHSISNWRHYGFLSWEWTERTQCV